MDLRSATLFIIGLVLLIGGAEALVRGASRLAEALRISPLIIGLTVVAWGTGSPEMAVGVGAAFRGQPDLVIGNVVGSNIANVLLILGLAAIITPLVVSQRLVRLDVPLMIGVSGLALLLCLDGRVTRLDGLLLFTLIVAYTVWSIRESRKVSPEVEAEYVRKFGLHGPANRKRLIAHLLLIGVGLVALVLGSAWLVEGAVAIAETLGLSKLVIGLTIVAIGTSLPELATSAVASFRKERDIAVGNVVGSNIFNILAVLGVTAVVAPAGIRVTSAALSFDIPFMIAVAIACLPIFFSANRINRWEGVLFLGAYVSYIAYLVLKATHHDSLAGFTRIMLLFVVPLTVLTLLVIMARALQQRHIEGD
ncbi:MAG: calcium/sodium antiporter [Acidobacteriota bacterium]